MEDVCASVTELRRSRRLLGGASDGVVELGIRECRTRARRCESRSEVPGGFSGVRKRRYGAARTRPKTSSRGRSHAPEARAAFVAMYRCVRVAVVKYESLPSKVRQCATRVLFVRSDGIRGDTRVCDQLRFDARRLIEHFKRNWRAHSCVCCCSWVRHSPPPRPSSRLSSAYPSAPSLAAAPRCPGSARGATGAVPARARRRLR